MRLGVGYITVSAANVGTAACICDKLIVITLNNNTYTKQRLYGSCMDFNDCMEVVWT